MAPDAYAAYGAYFGACATVAGTLIGLLFVAVSVSPHKDVGRNAPLSFQIEAATAITTLTNTLVISLVALMPGEDLGGAAVILAGIGISSTIGMAVISLRNWPGHRHLWALVIIPALGILYALQLANGINLLLRPDSRNSVQSQALLVLIFFPIAVARAWNMIGARGTRLSTLVGELVQERQTTAADTATVDPPVADTPRGDSAAPDPTGRSEPAP